MRYARSISLCLTLMLGAWSASAIADDDDNDAQTIHVADLPKDAPRFEQFPATEWFNGRVVPPDVKSREGARMFRTAIRRGAKDGPNFAGHYTVVGWGCGAGCQAFALVDANSGKVYFPPNLATFDNNNVVYDGPEGVDERLIKYRKNSRMLIIIGGINEEPGLRGISYFIWAHNKLRRIRFVAKPNR